LQTRMYVHCILFFVHIADILLCFKLRQVALNAHRLHRVYAKGSVILEAEKYYDSVFVVIEGEVATQVSTTLILSLFLFLYVFLLFPIF
jgi:hypothetical protein